MMREYQSLAPGVSYKFYKSIIRLWVYRMSESGDFDGDGKRKLKLK